MSIMTGISVDDFVNYGGSMGDATAGQVNTALQLAWNLVEQHIQTQLYPYPISGEVHPWPANSTIQLKYTDLASVAVVRAKHDELTCNCDVLTVTGCAIVRDPVLGIIDVRECYASQPCRSCGCGGTGGRGAGSRWPMWAEVDYTAGVSAPLNDSFKFGIVQLAKTFLAKMLGQDVPFGVMQVVTSWHSMSYGESGAGKIKSNPFSMPSDADMIKNAFKPWPRKRAVAFMGNPRSARIL